MYPDCVPGTIQPPDVLLVPENGEEAEGRGKSGRGRGKRQGIKEANNDPLYLD